MKLYQNAKKMAFMLTNAIIRFKVCSIRPFSKDLQSKYPEAWKIPPTSNHRPMYLKIEVALKS